MTPPRLGAIVSAAALLSLAGVSRAAERKVPLSSSTLTCDFLEYESSGSVVTATGRAVLVSSGTRLTADRLVIDLDDRTVVARGAVTVDDGGLVLLSDEARFDAASSSGVFVNGYFEDPPHRLWARRIVRVSSELYHMEHAAMTSCDRDPPHYHVRAASLDYVPGKRASAVWPRLALGEDTVFGWPYYSRHFRKKPWTFTVDPGRSSYQGLYAKSIFSYRLTESGTARLYWDHFQKTGNGLGAEYTHAGPGARGTLYGYRIEDRRARTSRWNARLAHWQQLAPRLSLEFNALAQSDSGFNNLYFRDDLYRVRTEALSNAALTHQRDAFVSRLSLRHDRVYDPARGSFVGQRTVLPEAAFQGAPWGVGRRAYLTVSAAARREYERPLASPPALDPVISAQDRFKGTGEASVDLKRVIALGRRTTLQPAAGVSGAWASWRPDGPNLDPRDVLQGKVFAGANLRRRLTRRLDLDLAHLYRVRWTPRQIKRQHADPVDQGLEANALSLTASYRRSTLTGRLSAGYDLRDKDGETLLTPRRKAVPPALDLGWTPGRRTRFSYRQVQDLYPARRPKAGWFSWRTEFRPGFQLSSGYSYNGALPGGLQLRHGASWPLTRGWHVEGEARYLVQGPGRLRYDSVPKDRFEQEYVLRRDLHCWRARASWRSRPGFHEFYIRVDLQSRAAERRALSAAGEDQYYPGRDKE